MNAHVSSLSKIVTQSRMTDDCLNVVDVQFICQEAGGSGIPEVIGFLNGTVMRHVLNLPAICVKFFSCSCAVGAGLPVGPEGPMIHIGLVLNPLAYADIILSLIYTVPAKSKPKVFFDYNF